MRWQQDRTEQFREWCIDFDGDLQEFAEALKWVPAGPEWQSLAASLLDEFTFGSSLTTGSSLPVRFETVDPDRDQLRDSKRRIVEQESDRRRRQ